MVKAVERIGQGFPSGCSEHGIRAGSPSRSRAQGMIGSHWPELQNIVPQVS